MSTLLDAHVKGSLPSGLPASTVLNPQAGIPTTLHPPQRTPLAPTNPLDTAPSSPQQIYLNLLILEASLRSQYLALTLRRRKYTFFFLLLISWTSYFTHSIFIHGPSPYYYISLLQKLALGAGVMTLAIFWLSGLHRKTLVFPRKFVGNTNKGLRQFNIKLVSVRLTLWERFVGWLVIFPAVKWIWPWCPALPYIPPGELEVEKSRSFGEVLRGFLKHGHHGPPNPAHAPPPPASMLTPGRKRRLSQASRMSTPPPDQIVFGSGAGSLGLSDEEPLQPSGSHVKLVILPKGFSPDFREGWEIYRTDYWEKENERRAILRKQIRSHQSFFSRFFSPAPASIPTNYISTISSPPSTSTPKPERVHHLRDREHHHTSSSSPRRVGTPEPISRSATPDLLLTPDGVLDEASTSTTGSPRRTRRGSTASLNRPHRKSSIASIAGSTTGGTGTPPPVMGPLTTLRSEILADEGDVSDAGSIRSIAGSINDGVGNKRRGSGKKTRGSKRGRGTKGESSRGGEGGGSTAGSAPGTPA